MMHELQDWINGMDPDAQQQTIAGLTKVRPILHFLIDMNSHAPFSGCGSKRPQ